MTTEPWQSLSNAPHELGEGLRVLDGVPHWVDLLVGVLHASTPGGGATERLRLDRPLGAVEQHADGRWIAAAGTGVSRIDDGRADPLADTGLDPARYRVNDAALAPDGSLWFGTMVHDGSAPDGGLWRWSGDSLRRLRDGIDIPNGPVFLDDGRVLLADSAAAAIRILDPVTGADAGAFADVEGGSPDGLHHDREGRIWNAVWGAARLDVHDRDGSAVRRIPLPVQQPTSVLVHELDGIRSVLVTSALLGLDDPSPLDGHTIAAPLDAVLRGAPE